MSEWSDITGGREIVVVANRLPVDRFVSSNGVTEWHPSPGGLVSAMEPIVRELGCVWVGWPGDAEESEDLPPREYGSTRLVPVPLDNDDIVGYYEGFSNGALWPLYHDVIAPPAFHRDWWVRYQRVNRRFAEAAAREAPEASIVWVHDYQLQLVPQMLRELRPDLTIAFFLHIPFPSHSLFAQLPWRREIVEGILGADVVGFQREQDAVGFRFAAERYAGAFSHGNMLLLKSTTDGLARSVLTQEFPISIDVQAFSELAATPEVRARAKQIRAELGDPRTVMLGVDRLDYTKGIMHRLKAFAELLANDDILPEEAVLVQVASPSRERVTAYRDLREEIETTVGRINGEYGSIGFTPVVYLHQNHAREEMAALYLAADVLVVTSLRDGMNLVAKEYVACRTDQLGALVLSEFAGAADELSSALLVNPHDIEGLKSTLLRAAHMSEREQRRRMGSLLESVQSNDVHHWAGNFLRAAVAAVEQRRLSAEQHGTPAENKPVLLTRRLEAHLRRLATATELVVACDFDGTLAPIVGKPEDARMLDRSRRALEALQNAPGVTIALLTGRSLKGLEATGINTTGWILYGSHGAELRRSDAGDDGTTPAYEAVVDPLTEHEQFQLEKLHRRLTRLLSREQGVRLEQKPFGITIHTRQVSDAERSADLLDAAAHVATQSGFSVRDGKRVRECSLRFTDKGTSLEQIRAENPSAPILFIGDDVTDEDAFAVLGIEDVGIKVGQGDTAATDRVPNPESVAAVLAKLVELRTGIVIGTDAN